MCDTLLPPIDPISRFASALAGELIRRLKDMQSRYDFPWQGLGRNAPERTRLRIVGLASEIAVLTALMHDDLAAFSLHPLAREFKRAGWEHRRVALDLLSPETRFEAFTREDLETVADSFAHRLQDVRYLRGRVSTFLLARKAPRLSVSELQAASSAWDMGTPTPITL